jgi:hypothetical protein
MCWVHRLPPEKPRGPFTPGTKIDFFGRTRAELKALSSE